MPGWDSFLHLQQNMDMGIVDKDMVPVSQCYLSMIVTVFAGGPVIMDGVLFVFMLVLLGLRQRLLHDRKVTVDVPPLCGLLLPELLQPGEEPGHDRVIFTQVGISPTQQILEKSEKLRGLAGGLAGRGGHQQQQAAAPHHQISVVQLRGHQASQCEGRENVRPTQ